MTTLMNFLAFVGVGIAIGTLAAEAKRSFVATLGWMMVAFVPAMLFTAPGLLRPKIITSSADVTNYKQLSRPGIHTFITNKKDTTRTIFVWDGVVNDSLYIIGMRPVREVVFVDHDAVTDTLRWQ